MPLVIEQHFGLCIFSLRWSGDPEPMAVTLGVNSDATTEDDVITVAGGLANAFIDNFIPVLLDDITLVQTEVRFQLAPLPAAPVLGIATDSASGEILSNALPQNCALLVHKRTATGGRAGRGRMFFPGCAEGNISNLGELDGTMLTSWNSALAGFLSDLLALSDPTVIPVLLHANGGPHAADVPHPITALTIDPVIATQRRRLRH